LCNRLKNARSALPSSGLWVFAENGLPQPATLARGERGMLERNRLDTFYSELQTPFRTRVTAELSKSEKKKEMQEIS
jgi:hypothetical protein